MQAHSHRRMDLVVVQSIIIIFSLSIVTIKQVFNYSLFARKTDPVEFAMPAICVKTGWKTA
jgi:hypothetical protein